MGIGGGVDYLDGGLGYDNCFGGPDADVETRL
jgi:hypothetical protein